MIDRSMVLIQKGRFHLAKVNVESSNLFTRSIFLYLYINELRKLSAPLLPKQPKAY